MTKRLIRKCSLIGFIGILATLGGCGDSSTKNVEEFREASKKAEGVSAPEARKFYAGIDLNDPKVIEQAGDKVNVLLKQDPNFEKLRGIKKYFEDPRLFKVTSEYGYTKINLKALPLKQERVNAPKIPWSSWWFPGKDSMDPERSLFKGERTPLGKYDIVRRSTFLRQGSASEFEDAEFSKFKNPPDWRGLCDGWAMASVLFEEPLESVWKSVDNRWIELTPYDLKALIIKSYEDVGSIDGSDTPNMKYYGMKFDGADSWILPDIFPEQFHRFLEEVMFKKRELFLMDHDPKQEIWTEPVYGSEYEIKAGPTPDSVDVKTWVYSAGPRKKWEDRNKQGIFIRSRSYQYRLYGTVDASGVLTVNSGEWMNREGTDSTVDHPDYFIRLINPGQLSRATRNPFLETDVVDSLLKDSYDLAQQKKNQGNK